MQVGFSHPLLLSLHASFQAWKALCNALEERGSAAGQNCETCEGSQAAQGGTAQVYCLSTSLATARQI